MCILETVELVREKRTCLISDVSAAAETRRITRPPWMAVTIAEAIFCRGKIRHQAIYKEVYCLMMAAEVTPVFYAVPVLFASVLLFFAIKCLL